MNQSDLQAYIEAQLAKRRRMRDRPSDEVLRAVLREIAPWVSVDRPEIGRMGWDDVWPCEDCGGRGEVGHEPTVCPSCRGHRWIHGYDHNLRPLPARRSRDAE